MTRTAALTVLLWAAASPVAAQYAEPFARRPGVSPPPISAARLDAEAVRLGFRDRARSRRRRGWSAGERGA